MAPVGHAPTQTAPEIIAEAEQWYAQYDGSNSSSNTDGMSQSQLYQLLAQIGIRYLETSVEPDMLRAWLRLGYPLIVGGAESSFHDLALGGNIPYPWRPLGGHFIVLTGVNHDGNYLVRDSANITDQVSLRPGPRTYDSAQMQLFGATVIVPPWLPAPPADFDPRKQPTDALPPGWRDDGLTLIAPNGHKVVRGFRDYVLSHAWHPENVPLQEEQGRDPLEESNPSLGGGTQQIFNWTMLEWTPARGVFIAWIGQELLHLRADKAALAAQVADLEARL